MTISLIEFVSTDLELDQTNRHRKKGPPTSALGQGSEILGVVLRVMVNSLKESYIAAVLGPT